ncbi:MAG: hypothetical protein WC455_29610 [Dehalococcoidia bacterium]|jgi:hypothetical protein
MTNQPPTNQGILTDKEGTGFPGLRIDDKPWTVAPYVQRYLDAIPKKAPVCFQTTDGKITKIWEDKPEQPATQPQQEQKKETARPQEAPADAGLKPDVRSGPKKIDGEIININPEKRNLALRSLDEKGYEITTLFVWRENRDLDQAAIKQKPGWYVTVTYEAQGEINHAQDIKYCDRPASMKKKTGYSGGSGKTYTPRNEKPGIYGCCYKEACETMRRAILPQIQGEEDPEKMFDRLMDIAKKRALKDAAELCTAAGCQ